MNTEPGQDTHVFTRIVIFKLSGKEPNESAIVKRNIDQNNFCEEGSQISILPWATPTTQDGPAVEHNNRVEKRKSIKPIVVEKSPCHASKTNLVKQPEIQFAVGIACHGSIASVYHLRKIASKHGAGSTIGSIQLHQTKCSNLITKVVSPALKSELRNNVAGKRFVPFVPDSTDIATKNNLCVCIRQKTVRTAFLGLVKVV